MKKAGCKMAILVGLCSVAFCVSSPLGAKAAEDLTVPSPVPQGNYVIGPGDVLEISVWRDEALTQSVTVLPDGRIAFPLIGEVEAADRTVAELKEELEERIGRFVPDPVLSVSVKQATSMLIYVIGRVNNPGRFALNANTSVLQALAMAGGLNPFAKRGSIKIFREDGEETRIYEFDYDEVSRGRGLNQNIWLKRGDVIVVP